MEFHSPTPCPPIPDDLTIPQLMLDNYHPRRPLRTGNIPWLIDDATGRQVGFEELFFRTRGLANSMHLRWGVGEGDVVCIFSPNHVDYPVAIWSAHRLGAIVSCANPAYTPEELAYQLTVTKAFILIVHPDSLETALTAARQSALAADHIFLMDELKSQSPIPLPTISRLVKDGLLKPLSFNERKLAPGEGKTKIAFLSFSSGTTGKPKAVAISHLAMLANVFQQSPAVTISAARRESEQRRYRPGDVALGVLPFYHVFGLTFALHTLLFMGLTLVAIPKFNLKGLLDSIVKYKITHLLVVPPQIVLLCKHPLVKNYNLSHVRFVLSGAAPLSPELMMQLVQLLPNAEIGQGYGMTEAAVTLFPFEQRVITPGSVGRLVPGTVARIRKPDGTFADYDEEGELELKGPQVALGYINDEKATRETFADGWLRTGDQVKIARNGDVFILDRLKEMIKVRGFQVAPAELEGHLLEHPDVADACVVGVPDDYSGEIPFAFVVPDARVAARVKGNAAEAEKTKQTLIKHVSDGKVPYKRLAGGVEFIDTIPKSSIGKILRRELKRKAIGIAGSRNSKPKL